MSATAAKTKLTVELMRKGAVMIKEPCSVDNGVQVRYKGKVYCTNHDDLSMALHAREIAFQDVAQDLSNLLLVKLKEAMSMAEGEKDRVELDKLVSLMSKYVELLQKLESPQRA